MHSFGSEASKTNGNPNPAYCQLNHWETHFRISYIVGLMQERCNSIANALELHLSCTNPWCIQLPQFSHGIRADSSFAPSQWEMALLCNHSSHWLGANLESFLRYSVACLPSVYVYLSGSQSCFIAWLLIVDCPSSLYTVAVSKLITHDYWLATPEIYVCTLGVVAYRISFWNLSLTQILWKLIHP